MLPVEPLTHPAPSQRATLARITSGRPKCHAALALALHHIVCPSRRRRARVSATGRSSVRDAVRLGRRASQRGCRTGRPRKSAAWSAPLSVGQPVNAAAEETAPALSDDGVTLYFNRNNNLPPDNHEDLYVTHRSSPQAPWADPVAVAAVNTFAFHERNATLSRDGLSLFFSSDRPGGVGGPGPLRLATGERER
jgi:hypothetical protein